MKRINDILINHLAIFLIVFWTAGVGRYVCAQDSLIALITDADTTYYAHFPDALKKVNKLDSSTIVFLGDLDLGDAAKAQAIRKNLTIDLNGYSFGDTLLGAALLSLAVDTVRLTITSSRAGGRLWAMRDYDGKISAVSVSKGSLEMHNISIDVHNTAEYHPENQKKVAANCVSVGALASLTMTQCTARCEADKSAVVVSGAGSKASSADIQLRDCHLTARGKTSVYGLSIYNSTYVEHCVIDVEASEATAQGIHLYYPKDSTLSTVPEAVIKDVQIRVKAFEKAYGVFSGTYVLLDHDTMSVDVENHIAYGVYCTKKSAIETNIIRVHADSASAYGISVMNDSVLYSI